MKEYENLVDAALVGSQLKEDIGKVLDRCDEDLKYYYTRLKIEQIPKFKMRCVAEIKHAQKRRDMMRSLIFTFYDLIDHAVEKEMVYKKLEQKEASE